MSLTTFKEWLTKATGKPVKPSQTKKLNRKETFSAGVRDMRKDLSADYPGNIETHGDTGPFKLLGKSSSSKTNST